MVSRRAERISAFVAMDVLADATERADVVHLEVGEPELEPPDAVVDTAVESLRSGDTGYTAAKGTPELRSAIAARYERAYGVSVDPERIVVTPGSSPALWLAMATTVDPGDPVVLTDPHYASYPNLVTQVGGQRRTVPLRAADGFQPRLAEYEAALDDAVRAVLVNSPANPTGAVLDGETLSGLVDRVAAIDATVIADEIYHGLAYGREDHSVLEYTDEAFVVDGVSKRYGMTGWRLGWVVAPPAAVDAVERLAQNFLICAPRFVQDAAVEALGTDPEWLADVRETYRRRRDRLLEIVADWGLPVEYEPDGAYYLLVDASDLPGTATEVAELFLEEAGVAVTPGIDFGRRATDYLRLSYATDLESLETAGERVDALLATLEGA